MTKSTFNHLLCLTFALTLFGAGMTVFADEGMVNIRNIAVENAGKSISGVIANPVTYTEQVSGGMLNEFSFTYNQGISGRSVLYTASFPFTTTKRTGVWEYTVERQGADYVVVSAGAGDSYIPVGGFVLSLPDNDDNRAFAEPGDKLGLTAPKDFTVATRAVECVETGVRIAIDQLNSTRSAPMVVYYDYQYGKMTGTNQYGTEMTVTYDYDENAFQVVSFRPFGEGSQSGIAIPDSSFVLSTYGTPYRGFLMEGVKFHVGDRLELIGFDYVRTDSTVTGTFDFINPTKETNPVYETDGVEFPAFRGTDQTIIYRDGWNYKNLAGTGTNVYG